MNEDALSAHVLRRFDDGRAEGTLRCRFAGHARDVVWQLLTEPAGLAQWLAPGTIEPRAGGRAHIDFADSGIVIDSPVQAFEPPRVLAYSWSSAGQPERPLRWVLEGTPGGTDLTLTVGTPAGEDAAKACAGFAAHLEMLAAALEGVPIRFPFDLYVAARAHFNRQLGV